MELKRKITDKLIKWKETSKGSTALLIEGARRVGKTYSLTSFGKNYYKSYILVDFSTNGENRNQIYDLFEKPHDLDMLFNELSLIYQTPLYKRDTLIILDEIQLCKKARERIKEFVADGRYDYIESGSLLSISEMGEGMVLPSEEEKIKMYPLDFEEFCWAKGDYVSIPFIKDCFDNLRPLGENLHKTMMSRFREYLIVGGMPQAVLKYIDTKNFEQVDTVKRNILSLYREDIAKYAKNYKNQVRAIFDEMPTQLAKKEKKFTLSSIDKRARMRNYENSFMWLIDSQVAIPAYNSTDPKSGLKQYSDRRTLKLYMMDTGLLITHAFSDESIFKNELYIGLLNDKYEVDEGMIMENAVCQALKNNHNEIYFYSRNSKKVIDGKEKQIKMELDFLIRDGYGKICPIEVKSGRNYQHHKSINEFRDKFKGQIGTSYILYTKDVMVNEEGIVHLPLYMAMFL
ncbi:MAG: ATP-binding protein [Coprobacillus sp.]|nr:ATP-binding protein [Coprobacillus sp.]